MSKIRCVFHAEDTASLEIYEDGFFCFGCAKTGTLAELVAAGVKDITPTAKEPPEDLAKTLEYVNTLPRKQIRGFDFAYDDSGYYIQWPTGKYYKKRLWEPKPKQSKYYCPRGHTQPMFFINRPGSKCLFFVEGEINALSLAQAFPEASICSPGGTSQFNKDSLHIFKSYDTVVIVVDYDKAGVMAYIELQSKLGANGIVADRVLMTEDANDVLNNYGKDKLKETIENARR